MDPLVLTTSTSAIVYVADVILKHHIKETWLGKILPLFFPKETYRERLEQLLTETIVEFRKEYPPKTEETRIQFFEDGDTMAKFSMFILFKEGEVDVLASDFESKRNVIPPTQEEINFFYKYFIAKIKADEKLKKLFINEQYQEEIFRISQDIRKLTDDVKEINDKTTNIKSDTSQILKQSAAIQDGLKAITERFGATVKVTYQLAMAQTEAHPLAEHVTKRIETIDKWNKIFDAKLWLSLTGSISTGKTQFAILIAERHTQEKFWIGLRQFDANNYILKIVYSLASSLKIQPDNSIEHLLDDIEKELSKDHLIILDDIPRLNGRTKADELFISFIKKCIQKGVKILSTSNYQLPASIKQYLPTDKIEITNIPFFTEDEVEETLVAFGANHERAESIKKFISTISYGHPTIVAAIGRYLSSKGWQFNHDELSELFSGNYSEELNDATYENISETIDDEDTRELLHRLNLIIGSFSPNEVTLVCDVKPTIKLPLEKFHSINGLWVQNTAINKYELSPLIKRLKNQNLNTELREGINYSLGKAIIDKKHLNQTEASKAINYFVGAKAYNDAGFVLVLVLNESLNNPEFFFDWNFDLYWYKQMLPEGMDIFLKMYIRVLHLMLEQRSEEDYVFLKNDLENIVKIASLKGINIGPAALLLSNIYATEDPTKSSQYFILGLKDYDELNKLLPFEKEISKEFAAEKMVWTSAIAIKSKTEIENWFVVFEQLTPDQRQNALDSDSETIDLGCMIIGKNLISEEEKKTGDNRDWNKLLDIFEHIQKQASKLGIDLLVANAIRYRINILSEKLNKIDEAKQIAIDAIPQLPDSPIIKFLIKDSIGRQLFYHGNKKEAMQFVADAVDIEVGDFYTEKLDTYLVMSQLLGEKDQKSAHKYSEQALEFANENQFFTETLQAKVIGEYAISLALNRKVKEAVYALENGYQILLDSYVDSIENKYLVLWYGHIINYWNQILNIGAPPLKDISGNPYMAPYRGMLLQTYVEEKVENIYFEERRFITAYIFFTCFEKLGDFASARKWAYNSSNINSDLTSNAFFLITGSITPYLIIDNKYNEAINWQLKIIDFTNEASTKPEVQQSDGTNEFLRNIVKDRPRIKIDQIDEIVLENAIVPITLHAISSFLSEGESKEKLITDLTSILKKWVQLFSNPESLLKVIELFNLLLEGKESKHILEITREYKGNLAEKVIVIGYLLASLEASSKEALKIHFALIGRLEGQIKQLSIGTYKFILIPFFEKFWFKRQEEKSGDFSNNDFWESRSVPYYKKALWDQKLKKLFKILCHHLDYEPSVHEAKWMDS